MVTKPLLWFVYVSRITILCEPGDWYQVGSRIEVKEIHQQQLNMQLNNSCIISFQLYVGTI